MFHELAQSPVKSGIMTFFLPLTQQISPLSAKQLIARFDMVVLEEAADPGAFAEEAARFAGFRVGADVGFDHPIQAGEFDFDRLRLTVGVLVRRADAVGGEEAGEVFDVDEVMDWGLAKFRDDSHADSEEGLVASTFHDPRTEQDEDLRTRTGSFLGTPAYMSPEQAIGAIDQIDERSDVFGLGAILCNILTGEPPFIGGTAESTRQLAAQGRLSDAFARLDRSGADLDLIALCKRCMSPEKASRPASGREVANAVSSLRADAEQRARRAELERVRSEGERAKAELHVAEQRKRRKVQLALVVTIGLLAIGIGSFAWLQDKRSSNARDEESRRQAQTDQETTTALAELALLCDRGNQEIENPIRWRLTLTAARAAQRRAAAALEAGRASHLVRERFRIDTEQLDRDEFDCETAEECERWFASFFDLFGLRNEEAITDGLRVMIKRAEQIFARLGVPLLTTSEDVIVSKVRDHRLRFPVIIITGFLRGLRDTPKLASDPIVGLRLKRVASQLLRGTGSVWEQVLLAMQRKDSKQLREILETPDGRALSSREVLIMYLGTEDFAGNGPPTNDLRRILLDKAIQGAPSDVLPLFLLGNTIHGSTFRFIGKDPAPKLLESRARVLMACAAAVALRPNVAELWSAYGRHLDEEDLHVWAAECYKKAILLDPTRHFDRDSLANALLDANRIVEAVEQYQILLRDYRHVPEHSFGDVRVTAARAAIRCAYDEGSETKQLSAEQKRKYRVQAITWLREALVNRAATSLDRAQSLTDKQFQYVREPMFLKNLPPDEALEWERLWAEVAALHKRTIEADAKPKKIHVTPNSNKTGQFENSNSGKDSTPQPPRFDSFNELGPPPRELRINK